MAVATSVFEDKVNTRKTDYEHFYERIGYNTVSAFGDKVILGCIIVLAFTVFTINAVNYAVILKFIEESFLKKFQHNLPAMRQSFQTIRIDVNGNFSSIYEAFLFLIRKIKKSGMVVIFTIGSLGNRVVEHSFNFLKADCIYIKDYTKEMFVSTCAKKRRIEVIARNLLRPDRKIIL